ncbi:small multidrug efflux protein [Microbacterium sp. Sa4CUA7]|uniref:Small multidrug efflux protein n=1 Tax=Microbacterium pullorum TaxID=2762236 RepID=A0ABR8S2Y8_9MICO|nr:small multidrug efflux protein [Microbacterium pullorum]MBD7957815.1 small multidrug efflux protein [Microbacterium pullorum]
MNLIDGFQDLVARVPELLQPLIIALAGAIPFVEGEGAAVIGIVGGIHPVVAAIAAIVGNFACVAVLVLAGAGARQAVVTRHRQRSAARTTVGGAGSFADATPIEPATAAAPVSARREKFLRALDRYGVPGVSLLGPLLLPTQFTATMLAASGVGRARILFWQALAIVGWTTIITLLVTGVFAAVR